MTLRFLTKAVDGIQQLATAIIISTGVADANKIVATDSSGKLNASLIPASGVIESTASVALNAGDFVAFNSSGEVILADNSDITTAAKGFVLDTVAANDVVSVYMVGVNSSLIGLTPNSIYFLGTSGGVTLTPPAFSAGVICQNLGFATTANNLSFEYNEPVQFANQ